MMAGWFFAIYRPAGAAKMRCAPNFSGHDRIATRLLLLNQASRAIQHFVPRPNGSTYARTSFSREKGPSVLP
jgi:hypothetical protein